MVSKRRRNMHLCQEVFAILILWQARLSRKECDIVGCWRLLSLQPCVSIRSRGLFRGLFFLIFSISVFYLDLMWVLLNILPCHSVPLLGSKKCCIVWGFTGGIRVLRGGDTDWFKVEKLSLAMQCVWECEEEGGAAEYLEATETPAVEGFSQGHRAHLLCASQLSLWCFYWMLCIYNRTIPVSKRIWLYYLSFLFFLLLQHTILYVENENIIMQYTLFLQALLKKSLFTGKYWSF